MKTEELEDFLAKSDSFSPEDWDNLVCESCQ